MKKLFPSAAQALQGVVKDGQLLAVGAAWALVRAASRWAALPRLQVPALYAMGTLAAYWSWSRIAAMLA